MFLTNDEATSPLWRKLKAHFEARLARARELNDISAPEGVTERRRGEIATMKWAISLDKPEHPVEAVVPGDESNGR